MKPVIICVDDEKMILDSLETELASYFGNKYDIEIALNAKEALELVEEISEDEDAELVAVISDYIMPGMTGDELLIKIHEKAPHVKNIMLTGQSRMEGISNVINNGNLYRYLEKPWNGKELEGAITDAAKSYYATKLIEAPVLQQLDEPVTAINHGLTILKRVAADIQTFWAGHQLVLQAGSDNELKATLATLKNIEGDLDGGRLEDDFLGTLEDVQDATKEIESILKTLKEG